MLLKRQGYACALFAALACSPLWAADRFGVSLGTLSSEAEAIALKSGLESSTCSLMIHEESGAIRSSYKVLAGPFNNYMDAWATNNALPGGFPSGRFIYSWKIDEQERADSLEKAKAPRLVPKLSQGVVTDGQAPNADSFVKVTVPLFPSHTLSEGEEANFNGLNREQQLSLGFDGKKNSDGVKALQAFLAANPSDSLVNAARIRLSRRLLAQKKTTESRELLSLVLRAGNIEEKSKAQMVWAYALPTKQERFDEFLRLADTEQFSSELRSHALRMAAGTAHEAREYTSAVLLFRQLEAEAPCQPERDEASMQLCGIQMELVGRAKGTWDEVIRSCDAFCDKPEASHQYKATVNLMRLEAMFHAQYINDAISACEEHLRIYPDVRREYIAASTWYGALLIHANRREEGQQALRAVLEMEISPAEKFGDREPKARAAYWLAFTALQAGDIQSRDRFVDYIRTNYPNSLEASSLARLQGN